MGVHVFPILNLLPPPSPSHPSGSSQCTSPEHLSHASNPDWWSAAHMIIYMFHCYSLRSSHPRLLPQSPKDCSIHLCLFCCLAYRGKRVLKVICLFWEIKMKVTFLLNSDSVEFVIWQEKGNALWKVNNKFFHTCKIASQQTLFDPNKPRVIWLWN